jgi:hypothetical protein
MARCCLCNAEITNDDAPVLTMGGAGNPRYLCENCAALIDNATLGDNYDEIKGSIEKLGTLLTAQEHDYRTTETLTEILDSASKRAQLIRVGEYDFDQDLPELLDDGYDEIPEEMLESEEDIKKDAEEEEKLQKFNKVYNAILTVIIIAFLGYMVWKLIENFFLK